MSADLERMQSQVQRLMWLIHTILERVALKQDYAAARQACLLCGQESMTGPVDHAERCAFSQLDTLIAEIESDRAVNGVKAVDCWPEKESV